MSCCNHCDHDHYDHEKDPYVFPVFRTAMRNQYYRASVWTGSYMQMTLMSINPYDDIGLEVHHEMDQFIRIEHGNALLKFGNPQTGPVETYSLYTGDGVFVPAGTWHNIINVGNHPLKISSIYAPPCHPFGTLQRNKPKDNCDR